MHASFNRKLFIWHSSVAASHSSSFGLEMKVIQAEIEKTVDTLCDRKPYKREYRSGLQKVMDLVFSHMFGSHELFCGPLVWVYAMF